MFKLADKNGDQQAECRRDSSPDEQDEHRNRLTIGWTFELRIHSGPIHEELKYKLFIPFPCLLTNIFIVSVGNIHWQYTQDPFEYVEVEYKVA